jgi:hypothetical protein
VDGDGAAAEVEVLDLQEPQLVLAEREPPEQLNRDLVAEAWLGRRSLSMTSGLYACGSTFLRFGGLIFAAGLSPSPRSSTAQAKNDLVTASLFRRVEPRWRGLHALAVLGAARATRSAQPQRSFLANTGARARVCDQQAAGRECSSSESCEMTQLRQRNRSTAPYRECSGGSHSGAASGCSSPGPGFDGLPS